MGNRFFLEKKNCAKLMAFFLVLGLLFSVDSFAKDLYEILGVSKTATSEEIKGAYRRLATKYHPDRYVNDPGAAADAEVKFKEMKEAYEILSDSEKRNRFDQGGTIEDIQRPRSRQWSDEDVRRYHEHKDRVFAEMHGPKYSNAKWTYHPASHGFYDSRIRKWSYVKNTHFQTAEGWLFQFTAGTYMSTDMRAYFNPEEDIGWYRRTSNFGDNAVLIDPETGFSRAARYAPGTVSDSSHLFEELMNPVNLLDSISQRGNRPELMKKFEALSWTESRLTDFITRAKAHTTVLARPDMKINFAGDSWYFNAAMSAVLDYEVVRKHPEIVVDFLRRAQPQYRYEIPKALLMKDEWLNHKNASVWLTELFRYPEGTNAYLEAALSGERARKEPRETTVRFKTAYAFMEKVGMNANTIDLLIGWLGYLGHEAYDVFADEMLDLTYKKTFLELMATLDPDPERTNNVKMFLAWYSKQDPNRARIFEQTLNMPGTKRWDFWRLSADRTQYSLAETEYNAHKARTSAARLRFMDANLPKSPSSNQSSGRALRCSSIVSKRSQN